MTAPVSHQNLLDQQTAFWPSLGRKQLAPISMHVTADDFKAIRGFMVRSHLLRFQSPIPAMRINSSTSKKLFSSRWRPATLRPERNQRPKKSTKTMKLDPD
ncbi:hypothetical protein [Bradyrhizobium acaciae]|uniref:hypothetical protein n=1 Tax=Bradyrhizobium acaciae TaxID=2683706 RepID=UPI001E481CBB|nr:hypothetical protein [Bradyrhizobium acaciae]MCC8979279.1 hypothetical protein [Bradyrhizobium acaciae]